MSESVPPEVRANYYLFSKRRVHWTLGLGAVVMVLLFAARGLWLPWVGGYLVVSDELRPADYLIVLGGGTGEREEFAAELFRSGLAAKLITTGGRFVLFDVIDTTFAEFAADLLVSHGVPRAAITALSASNSTCDDAYLSLELIQESGATSLLVVSDPYHMRRARLIFERVYAGSGIDLRYAPVANASYQADSWWTTERGLVTTFNEYVKLPLYITGIACSGPNGTPFQE